MAAPSPQTHTSCPAPPACVLPSPRGRV
ncbi:hypothetical protein E2C01_094933 [Portunus trituberculatus]|uniref:Uncharacterized protein n=1 Tax=Portunus trituberculatus TaxID=210409 RepID=A0A5B7K4G6_PORTR|nr:hypothetical protein [Portunus trituberculatus]